MYFTFKFTVVLLVQIDDLMRTVGALYDAKEQKLRDAMVSRTSKHRAELRKEEERMLSKRKTLLRKVYATLGKDEVKNYKMVGAKLNNRARPKRNESD